MTQGWKEGISFGGGQESGRRFSSRGSSPLFPKVQTTLSTSSSMSLVESWAARAVASPQY